MKKIYLCGAMGHYEDPMEYKTWRCNFFESEYDYVFHKAVTIFDPAELCNYEEKIHRTESETMEYDLYNLHNSDLVVVNLDRIHESVESIIEIYTAKQLGIPVVAFGDASNLHPWLNECIMRTEDNMDDLIRYIDVYFLNV